ncbi:hypothetical protein AB9F38_35605, partial [Rhizobium leguminosarum]
RHIDGVRDPLDAAYPWYVLIDISTSDSAETAERMMNGVLEQGFEAGLVLYAAIAASVAQQKAIRLPASAHPTCFRACARS